MNKISFALMGILFSLTSNAQTVAHAPSSSVGVKSVPELSVVDEYNMKRSEFLKKREMAKFVAYKNKQEQDAKLQQALRQQAIMDEYRKAAGLPISRFENNKGPSHNESGITREMMGMLNSGPPMPKVPQTGSVISAQ